MTLLTLDNFWTDRLGIRPSPSGPLAKGWAAGFSEMNEFIEAPLKPITLSENDPQPWGASLLMVSAPGAVGKSTLARQIAAITGAIYIDLALANPVGGHAITGGLAQSNLFSQWGEGNVRLLIDGLDEARLRVTQEAFEAFLQDIAELAERQQAPIVLFGRTSSIQDAWLTLADGPVQPAIMEIGFYEFKDAVRFVDARVRAERPDLSFEAPERKAIDLILRNLLSQTSKDANRFAGYAPVLQAVARRVLSETNASSLIATLESDARPITLSGVVEAILQRERQKLQSLPIAPTARARLYDAQEQLAHCVSRVYQTPRPPMPNLSASDAKVYATALESWVAEHPFLNGANQPSSTVFEALIAACALNSDDAKGIAAERELARAAAANPFLSEFYFSTASKQDDYLPPAHVGIIYASIRSKLKLGERASLSIEAVESQIDDSTTSLDADIEILITSQDSEESEVMYRRSDQRSPMRLTSYADDIEISLPYATVEIGPGFNAVLVAPINIACHELTTPARTVIIERSPMQDASVVYLETDQFSGAQISSVPILRGGVTLKVFWPGDKAFPWTAFASAPTLVTDARVDEALRRFRKFVTAFRSHSKGSLARYRAKLDHSRMTKGSGQNVLDLLLREKVIEPRGKMYHLDPDKLGEVSGATYGDCVTRQFTAETIAFIKKALDQ